MRIGPKRRAPALSSRLALTRPLVVCALVILGITTAVAFLPVGGATALSPASASHPSLQNDSSSGSDPSSNPGGLCPSAGPVILGIDWNCVAVLNLTELSVFLVSIGIIAYVFRDSDTAELPGDSAEVPLTAAELEAYKRARRLGLPYEPPEPKGEEEEG